MGMAIMHYLQSTTSANYFCTHCDLIYILPKLVVFGVTNDCLLAGAQIIDMMLLVVDATKGMQTQTAEVINVYFIEVQPTKSSQSIRLWPYE